MSVSFHKHEEGFSHSIDMPDIPGPDELKTEIEMREENIDLIPEDLIGVYYFLDNSDKILYIGKSIDIKLRIKQHLLKGRKRLMSLFVKVKIKVLKSELEALLFESQEIKINKPIFNRRLRKIKNQFFLHVSKNSNGVKNFTKHKIVFNSNDELKILTQFASKNKYSIIEYK